MNTKQLIIYIFICMVATAQCLAQAPLILPETSQFAEVKQRLGYTDITVTYHSPHVNNRKIWGGLVPYGQVWRAGANENTLISFTDDVSINGNPLPAGTYGLHMIPNMNEWVIIFSKDHTSWGSYFYSKDSDALRVTAKPASGKMQEWLDYTFTDRSAASSNVTMAWEKVRVSFKVSVDGTVSHSGISGNSSKISLALRGMAGKRLPTTAS